MQSGATASMYVLVCVSYHFHRDQDGSDVNNNHSGSEVVYVKEVLRIPGVINSHHCNTLKYHMYSAIQKTFASLMRLRFKIFSWS